MYTDEWSMGRGRKKEGMPAGMKRDTEGRRMNEEENNNYVKGSVCQQKEEKT